MLGFLRWFEDFCSLEHRLEEANERNARLQDELIALTAQVRKLNEETVEARAGQILALESIANIRMQIDFGGMPPYPDAYSLPRRTESELGPVPTDRIQGRDLVRQGMDDFHASIERLHSKQRR